MAGGARWRKMPSLCEWARVRQRHGPPRFRGPDAHEWHTVLGQARPGPHPGRHRGSYRAGCGAAVACGWPAASLAVLDPIVVVLVVLARPAGVWLALIVMTMDLPANVFVGW